jgi:hypothetical protein
MLRVRCMKELGKTVLSKVKAFGKISMAKPILESLKMEFLRGTGFLSI